MTMSKDLLPGTVIRHNNSGSINVLAKRKDDDSGWWNVDGSGFADRVLDDAEDNGFTVEGVRDVGECCPTCGREL